MNNKDIQMVSVCMITYNHEAYIAQAIEGVLTQKTNFPIELIIGEDCSTDNTREICIEYKKKYPEVIKLKLRENNLGVIGNFIQNTKHFIIMNTYQLGTVGVSSIFKSIRQKLNVLCIIMHNTILMSS